MNRFLAALFTLLTLAGCSTRSLSEYATSGVNATLAALDTGGTTTVSMTLNDPSSSLIFLQLTSDDSLEATDGTASQPLGESSELGYVSYSAAFLVDQGTFTVTLKRKKDAGAPNSVVTLPPAFTLTPPSSTTQSRAMPMSFTWTPASADPMTVTFAGSCLQSFTSNIPTGSTQFTLPAGGLQKAAASGNQTVPDSCSATATVTRERAGTLDPAFHGGAANAGQVRAFDFTTAP